MIFTHAQWVTARKKANVKSGLVRGVNMGALLDAFHNAANGKEGNEGRLAQVKTLTPLSKGLAAYKVKLAPLNKPDLMAMIDEMIKTINDSVAMGAKLANPIINIKKYVQSTIARAKQVVANGDGLNYGKLWKEDVRGVGTSLAKLKTMDPGVTDLHAIWLPYTRTDWDYAGKHVTEGIADPAQKIIKTKKAAQTILTLATKMDSEFKSRKYWL